MPDLFEGDGRQAVIIVDDIVGSFSERIYSHKSAWPRMQTCMLEDRHGPTAMAFGDKDAVFHGDVWAVSHAMEFNGEAYNLFGGWNEKVMARVARLLELDVDQVISLERSIPDLQKLLRPRADKTDLNFTDHEWGRISQFQHCASVHHDDLVNGRERIVLGDSHSISRYRSRSLVLRNDGLTMHGLAKRGINSYLDGRVTKNLVLQVGNVDIRHHLCRQPDPRESIDTMLKELRHQADKLIDDGTIDQIELTSPYPIEHEQRKIPKSGWYKGEPFHGTRKQRDEVRKYMTEQMGKLFDVHHWPRMWYEIDPQEYALRYMEKPQSVHLSPGFYEWDLEKNQSRG